MPKALSKTRKQWAAEIRAAHKQFADGFFKIGRTLVAAKKALPHGTFLKMIESDLPFGPRTAQRLMVIAADPRLTKATRASLLPKAWGVLHELSKLPDAAFEQALTSGEINPQTTREQAVRMVTIVSEPRTVAAPPVSIALYESVVAPNYLNLTAEPADEAPPMRVVSSQTQPEPTDVSPSDVASLALSQIERLVGELAMAVARGDIRSDAVFAGRVKAVADRLLSAITEGRSVIH